MKYKYGERRRASEYEKALVEYWKKNKTFEKSVENRPIDNSYVFYDGPPFITGNPHHGTLLSSIVKDAVPRFWTMRGKRVERRWGWDCHGLPAENFVEKQLGISAGETTPDGRFSIQDTRCLGCCGLAPVMVISGDVYGRLVPADVKGILEKYK